MITSHSGLGSCSSAMCSRASLSQDGKVLCKLFIPCLCPTGKNKHQVDNPIPCPSANTHSSNLQVLRMKLSFFTNMFPLKLFSVKLELEAASVSFLHGLFVLGLFSTQQSPNTWSTYSFSAVLSRVWQRVTVAFGRCSRSEWPFYPSALRESVSQIQEVVGLTEVSALPQNES